MPKDSITKEKLYRQVYNTWLIKCLGGNIGAYLEGYRTKFSFTDMKEFAPKIMMANDDIDVPLVWLDLFYRCGCNFTPSDMMESFLDKYRFNFSEYGIAKRNYRRGIVPPLSGSYNNDFWDCMGSAIRGEVFGLLFLNNIEKAMYYAAMDSSLDHAGETADFEKIIAGSTAIAWKSKSPIDAIEKALNYLNKSSKYRQIFYEIKESVQNNKSWEELYDLLHDKYGNKDATNALFNYCIILLGLIYGGKDFNKVMCITSNGAYDCDSTCAIAGALFAGVYGIESIDKDFVKMAEKEIVSACTNLVIEYSDFHLLTETTLKVIASLINAGENDLLTIEDFSYDLKWEKKKNIFELSVHYPDKPEIKKGEKTKVLISVKNLTDKNQNCSYLLKLPDNICANKENGNFTLLAKKEITLEFELFLPDSAKYVDETNLLDFDVQSEKNKESLRFGLVGCPVYRVSKIYSDGFRYKKLGEESSLPEKDFVTYGKHRLLLHTGVSEFDTCWVREDFEYLPENFETPAFEKFFNQGKLLSAVEDNVSIKDVYGFTGPACMYAFQKLEMPEDQTVQFHIGSTDPYKMWVNGKLIAEEKENLVFCIYENQVIVPLKKGINEIVVKIIRKGADNRFAYNMRQEPYYHSAPIVTNRRFYF